jgi:catechol 2,3-dioxygenase-like lactoylglutathione lyase family enzyme
MTTQTPELSLQRIAQIAINVHELPRAVRFYRDSLGLPLLFEVPGMAFLDCGGVRLMLGKAEKPEFDHAASILYYAVGDIRGAHAALVGRGVTFVDAPHLIAKLPAGGGLPARELWMAFFHDSEGNLAALTSEAPA